MFLRSRLLQPLRVDMGRQSAGDGPLDCVALAGAVLPWARLCFHAMSLLPPGRDAAEETAGVLQC